MKLRSMLFSVIALLVITAGFGQTTADPEQNSTTISQVCDSFDMVNVDQVTITTQEVQTDEGVMVATIYKSPNWEAVQFSDIQKMPDENRSVMLESTKRIPRRPSNETLNTFTQNSPGGVLSNFYN